MNVFGLRDEVITEYGEFVQSFIQVCAEDLAAKVEEHFAGDRLWPQPLLQLNPAFEPGADIDELVDDGVLHETCREIFRLGKSKGDPGRSLRLHRHQEEAIRAAKTGGHYVLTTGTGSGKSLAYIIPIVDHVLRHGSGRGIRAVVVYPMNALANSQADELRKFLGPGDDAPVRFAAYTGQEPEDRREELRQNPPDILLTNYVMLELILTRAADRRLINQSPKLAFIVLDELHTYRGRQGSDVSMLVRRVREIFAAPTAQCVGTSATLAGPGTLSEQQYTVAEVAGRIFGATVEPANVISETLRSATSEPAEDEPGYREAMERAVADYQAPESLEAYRTHPLSAWIEWKMGLEREDRETGRLRRRKPRPIEGEGSAAEELSRLTGLPEKNCALCLREHLNSGYELARSEAQPLFAFRLHQFISRGDMLYATLEEPEVRHVTAQGQQFVPGDRNRRLYPVVFCRECGQEYYPVYRVRDETGERLEPRDLNETTGDRESEAGFIYINPRNPWPQDPEELLDRLPEEYVESRDGTRIVSKSNRKYVPEILSVSPAGEVAASGAAGAAASAEGTETAWSGAPFRFCLNCGASFSGPQRGDFPKLGSLATEGRSSATTVLTASTVRRLRREESLPAPARKLLSFTDNRQDASLQTGHFNDFVQVALLRGAVFRALRDAGADGLSHEELVQEVYAALDPAPEDFARNPGAEAGVLERARKAFRGVLGYLVYRDQERGWRITAPNLEQVGLLRFDYLDLDAVAARDDRWERAHPALRDADPKTRAGVARTLLDWFRRELAVRVDYLTPVEQERITQQSSQHLSGMWALDPDERLERYRLVLLGPRPRRGKTPPEQRFLSRRSGFAQYLRRESVFPHMGGRLSTEDSGQVLIDLVEVLTSAGLLETEPADRAGTPGYALPAMALIWKAGDGTRGFHDPIRRPSIPEGGMSTNRYFVDLYRKEADRLKGLTAREHTAQVQNEARKEREEEFKEARLPILYASPTLELGVDIKELNVVNMRNVPPTPANYAQRSGRAGRNGQPALVLTYCSTFQSHDQYFFARPQQMVAGAVSPPRVDLLNEELLKAHIHAIWLGETGETLPPSIGRIVDIDDDLELPLNIDRRRALSVPGAKERTLEKAGRMLEPIREDLEKQPWYTADWLQKVVGNCLNDFDRACDRWRELYRAAKRQREYQHAILGDQSRPKQQRNHAAMLRRQAESQIDLLTQEHDVMQADFYTYRYLASEGFLPGYNFPRLPVTAYLPGQRGGSAREGRDEFLSRARFLAISEFGPQALIYHEGSRYQINRLMLPLREESTELPLQSVKICTHCGYLHPVTGEEDADVCESCGETLPAGFGNLIQMTHVGTRRMQRINSDEEERQRRGYEVVTAVRYARSAAGKQKYTAEVTAEGYPVLRMEYGHAANLWRINLGWRRRGALEPKEYGFKLDVERGDWMSTTRAAQQSRTAHSATNASDTSDVDGDGEDGAVPSGERRIETVIPFVQDTRNALVLEPLLDTTDAERRVQQMASLQSAFKKAIQAVFDLEETELAAEPLPNRRGRKRILLYEAAEGGAGVLQRLLSEGDAIARVARTALEILHYDPDTGDDRRRGPTGEEDCEAACYDCLMTYANQRDHQLLDRTTVAEYLRELAAGELSGLVGPARPDRHLGRLEELCESELERRWLHYLDEHRLRLPDEAQFYIPECDTRADFYYAEHHAVIYVDGPPHEYAHRRERDREQEFCLEEAGYFVIRFGSETEWEQVVSEYWAVFGSAT